MGGENTGKALPFSNLNKALPFSMSNVVRPDLDLVIQVYKSVLPDYDFMLRKVASEGKWIRFSPRLHELTARLKCCHYPLVYLDENRIVSSLFRAFLESDENIQDFVSELSSKSIAEQYLFVNECLRGTLELSQWMDENLIPLDSLDWSPKARSIADRRWLKIPENERQQITRFWQYALQFSLSSFFNMLALMVHGRKLTQLVNEAIIGDDQAFGLAVQIDKSIIEHIPYFKERYQRAQQDGEVNFLEMVGRRLAAPHLNGRIRHRLLFVLFALLESTHWLNELKHREILDICDALGLGELENRIETENALTKRLIEYRQFQEFNQMSMP
jgi:hypothetical protein